MQLLGEGQEAGASSPQGVEVLGDSTPTSKGGAPAVSVSTEEAAEATPDPSVVEGGGEGDGKLGGKEEEVKEGGEKEEEGEAVGDDGTPESLEQSVKGQSDS